MIGIITVTPLQLLIAKRVLSKYGNSDYLLLNINAHDSNPLRSKYHELAECAVCSDYLILDGTGLDNLKRVRKVIRRWKQIGITELLFASIDNVFVQYVLKTFAGLQFSTFDDGTVNIITGGIYHKKQKLPLKQHVLYYLLRQHRNQDWIKKNTKHHYTIFDIDNNIVENNRLKFISIIHKPDSLQSSSKLQQARVFIGFSQADGYIEAVDTVAPDYYIPHPMEKINLNFRNVVQTDLIAEEYIERLLEDYNYLEVYACGSTTLLNLCSERIARYVLDLHPGNNAWQKEYNSIAKSLGCRVLTMEDVRRGGPHG